MKEQQLLFSVESILDIHPLENFKILFDNLKADHLDSAYVTGRKPFSRQSLLKAIIFKNLTGLPTVSDLVVALRNNPSAAIRCGFDILKPLPSVERFSEFLRGKDNTALQKIRIQLIHEFISLGLIRGNYLSVDSCPLPAHVKENNLKTNVKDRFKKERILKGDPDARLGVMVTFSKSKKEISYFWGYRNHVVIDAKEELPVWEITKPANVHDSVMFIPGFNLMQKAFQFDVHAVMADGIYDTASILNYIITTLKVRPRIALNPRNTKHAPKRTFSKAGNPLCEAPSTIKRKTVGDVSGFAQSTTRKRLLKDALYVLSFNRNFSLRKDVMRTFGLMMISVSTSTMALSPSKKSSLCELALNESSHDCSVSVCRIPLSLG
jgi:hypothetical protein